MKIAVIGTGYVGLVAGVCFAEMGNAVICVDTNAATVGKLRKGQSPIFEPDMDELLARNIAAGRLSFTTQAREAVDGADLAFICVGTPPRDRDGEPELSLVYGAAKDIARAMTGPLTVVIKSTVPVGTGDAVEEIIRRTRPGAVVSVASNPEFLREGSAIDDFNRPDRIVIGVEDLRAQETLQRLYLPLCAAGAPLIVTRRRTSELTKYAANAFLATKISFINEMADLCEKAGGDVTELAAGIGLDERIGRAFLNAGPGYGGSCFPKDTCALLHTAQEYGVPLRVVEGTVAANNARKHRMAIKVMKAAGGSVADMKIAVLGLTFKPDTDDMREAPSIPLIRHLQRAGARIAAYDPQGIRQAREHLSDVDFHDDPYECARDADVVVLMTEWDEVRTLDLARLNRVMHTPTMVDLRNIYAPELVRRFGFRLAGIGRPATPRPEAPLPAPPAPIRSERELEAIVVK
ncbi:UDP-glucose/GDP-mannose dehydrogenase family protein [Starkeya sp. 3C]|uniref:UDP-glucose 6-dehydrogenase n=1 Tax=Ancylobacter moscoviensis TaxID=2597768 RepID=A0ABY3DM50_9HYPH|nr:UDP-glucose/GDP-mannose dehydrogenase family protein [Ancylobacter moscoviensis]TSJ60284.1 UDP-glucose/GDP-mannose dehydrogenase family protein [Ancylobacter moscoviensis]